MLWSLIGMLCVLAGIILLITGGMWGLVFLLGGLGVMILNYSTMMRGRGMEPNQGTVNGFNGQGKQQSEAVEASQPVIGEQPADIWEQVEKKS